MVKSIHFKCPSQLFSSLPALVQPLMPSLQWVVLKIKALNFESARKVSNTIIENMRAFIEQHNEGYREAERLRQAARRIFNF